MANIADVILKVEFPEVEFNENLNSQIINELRQLSYEYFDVLNEDETYAEIIMGSAWNVNIDALQNLCNTFGCYMIGVAYDFGNNYVESFELSSEDYNYEEITTDPKIGFETIDKLPLNDE